MGVIRSLLITISIINKILWTEGLYLRGYNIRDNQPITDDDIRSFALTLKTHKIKYAYLFAGPFNVDGTLPEYPFSARAQKSVALLKKLYPELKILPWIGGVQNKQLYLGDSLWVANALFDTKRLIDSLQVPGVHVDFEYILKGEPALDSTTLAEKPGDVNSYGRNVNEFHRKLRKILPDSFISSVVVSTSPKTKHWKRKTTNQEIKTLINYVDQLSFLFYDTSITDQDVFNESCNYLLRDIQTLNSIRDIQYLIGIGTFVNDKELQKYRNMEIENISNSLQTVNRGLASIETSENYLNGIAIACYWTTSDFDWRAFDKYWVKPKTSSVP